MTITPPHKNTPCHSGSVPSWRQRLRSGRCQALLVLGIALASQPAMAAKRSPAPGRGNTANLPQILPNAERRLAMPAARPLTPAQQVALPDGGAPPPPHGYAVVEDTETTLNNFTDTVRTHPPLGMPGSDAQQRVNGPNNLPAHFHVLGMPVKFNAPVIAPYQNDRAPLSYAGQATNGSTSLLINGDASGIH